MRKVPFNVQFVYGGIEFDVSGFYTPARPAPSIDMNNYDNTLCDCGDGEELEVSEVKVDGNVVQCEYDEFRDTFYDQIMDELLVQYGK